MKEVKIEIPQGYEVDKEKSTFEKIVFKKIKGEINSVEDAIEELGEDDETVKQLCLLQSVEGISDKIISEIEIEIVAKALNDRWVPNWKNSSEDKYFIWWNMEKNCFNYVDVCCRGASFSSRLCFKSEKLAEKASQILEKQYKNYFNY